MKLCYSRVINIRVVVPKDHIHVKQSSQTQKQGLLPMLVAVVPRQLAVLPGTRFKHERTADCFEHHDG